MAQVDVDNNNQATSWNGAQGQVWVERQAALDALQAPVLAPLLGSIDLAPGSRVLDIGCGSGSTSFELARRVGSDGHVLGLDISAPLLALARQRAPADAPVAFVEGDATIYGFEPRAADLLFSRNGVMFFADPVKSFANMRRGLRSGATVAFACWREVIRNPWVLVPLQAAQKALAARPAAEPVDPEAPGPYSFANEQRVARIMEAAGFTDTSLRPIEVTLDIGTGRGLEGALALAQAVGPASRLLEKQTETVRRVALDLIRDALAPNVTGDRVEMSATLWVVTTRA